MERGLDVCRAMCRNSRFSSYLPLCAHLATLRPGRAKQRKNARSHQPSGPKKPALKVAAVLNIGSSIEGVAGTACAVVLRTAVAAPIAGSAIPVGREYAGTFMPKDGPRASTWK